MAAWMIVLLLIPIVNIVVFVIMWAKICEARGKSPWLVIMIFIPIVTSKRYVRLSLRKPEHATVGQLERELGLTPNAMLRMRLVVEVPEPETKPTTDPYRHLRSAGE